MRALVSAFIAGLIFGAGLIVSAMVDPAKVLGFLDLAGAWDPSLALVMGGAIAVGLIGFALAARRRKSLLGLEMRLPAIKQVDRRLVVGSLLFGAGWGLAGICPGPGLVAAALGEGKAFVFLIAMVAGMALFEVFDRRR
jgi:uncharacterized membrane protein YedE/YeeE